MLRSRTRKARTFGSAPFVVNVSELDTARSLGLLRQDVPIEVTDCSKSNYGVAYQRRENIGIETHGSQKAIQERCKELAQLSGFQLFVKSFSSKANDSGNAKYVCKKLNGQQFFDKNTSYDEIECPFAINVNGVDGSWKVTRINFAHNHVMRVGFTEQPPAEGTLARSHLAKRNTTQDVATLTHLIEAEMLPRYGGKTDKMTGAAIARFLVGKGHKLGPSVISRIKSSIDERLGGDMTDSYQKLESYLRLVADKNPGSIMKFEKSVNGTFVRACFIPNIGIQVAKRSRRLYGFDGTHLKGEMNQRGVFLVATSKDFNSSILPFAFSLVPVENKEHWIWFLDVVKEALGDIEAFTALSDRDKGLQAAVHTVFPRAGHRFCLRHIKGNITSKEKISLTNKERGVISKMANCDCENDYKLFESELKITKPAAATYLSGISKQHWVKYVYQDHFKLPTYGETTSNLAEQSNNWIGNECRSAKPLDAFGLYFRKLSELVSSKRQLAAAWLDKSPSTTLVPKLAKKREDLIKAAGSCQITPCLAGAYDVLYLGPTAEEGYIHPWRLVDLPGAECTCGNWQDTDFPCVHAVAAAIKDGRDLDTLYDAEKMSIGYFKESYNVSFKPWPTDVILEKDTGLLVPVIQENPRENGKRGLKPGPKPKHKRKKTKGAE